ncbi:hypothetical protein MCOR27_011407 [Pyricularia oryzae]|uniref:Kynurenine formamidase n=1 Tax=Pyricularia grisea TaxID=148305 RepID=A0ABQ8NUH7_PYRGI|nr:hypothetical protein MCOR01_008833 [Pyricularia oryzae]KAI6301823.1 hypothetical protein MCOR33_002803 [Pyricularia grisea]KAH9439505.1 hypothetical protein MCOR02_003055 [Pyricularia oryzae]KAI6261387.1 hypothetical protein MCOR19_002420 [Pyricularia oryzae]KAI6265423.1 hypothetical protein MCOR27_011407 [Pyricularia oryzae]
MKITHSLSLLHIGLLYAMAETLVYSEHKYGQVHDLQTLGIWDFPAKDGNTSTTTDGKYWIVFIHGGAWRDPNVDLHSLEPTISRLLADEHRDFAAAHIAGFASINYRLSPHANFPQDPAATPANELRAAQHPEHIQDAVAAMTLLHTLRPLDRNRGGYVLTGHSCGATMSYQLLMGAQAGVPSPSALPFPLPAAVVGFEGIYDLNGLDRRKDGNYTGFMAAAFGDDRAAWDLVSPALFRGYADAWSGVPKHLAVVAHSPEDSLVDMDEAIVMDQALRESGVPALLFKDLTGDHDVVRQEGVHTARVLVKTIETLQS